MIVYIKYCNQTIDYCLFNCSSNNRIPTTSVIQS